jgi:hypothetical protein
MPTSPASVRRGWVPGFSGHLQRNTHVDAREFASCIPSGCFVVLVVSRFGAGRGLRAGLDRGLPGGALQPGPARRYCQTARSNLLSPFFTCDGGRVCCFRFSVCYIEDDRLPAQSEKLHSEFCRRDPGHATPGTSSTRVLRRIADRSRDSSSADFGRSDRRMDRPGW